MLPPRFTPRARVPIALAALALLSCKDDSSAGDTGPTGWQPDSFCPGAPGCESDEGVLSVGAGKVDITPDCFESWEDLDDDGEYDDEEVFFDCGCDRLCPEDEGYPGADEGEGDGEFQAVWLAGFHNNRPAIGVHDPLWSRAVVFDRGDTRIAVVELDLVGWFYTDILASREMLAQTDLGIDYLLVASTHQHEGPDTMGLWGETATRTGVDPEYMKAVQEMTVESVRLAVEDLREVGRWRIGSTSIVDYSEKGVLNLLRDSRDPKIIDDEVGVAHFEDTSGETIATLVHWGNHPEAIADENVMITSDYAHDLRVAIEEGVEWTSYTRPGLGGMALYLNGTVGGLMTPLGITVTDPDGGEWREYTFERNEVYGKVLAEIALDAVDNSVEVSEEGLSAAATSFYLPVENWGFQAMFLSKIIDRETYNWDESRVVDDNNMPEVLTEVGVVTLGPLQMLTVPGELFPELAIGGYDGSRVGTDLVEMIDEDNPNPPDMDAAPEGPYFRDHMTGELNWIIGLGNDQLGYIMPPYDFELHPTQPWFEEAEGDHYEETNSLGPQTAPILEENIVQLMGWVETNQ